MSESTPTYTDFTEGTPSYTASSPSCSSEVLGKNKGKNVRIFFCWGGGGGGGGCVLQIGIGFEDNHWIIIASLQVSI